MNKTFIGDHKIKLKSLGVLDNLLLADKEKKVKIEDYTWWFNEATDCWQINSCYGTGKDVQYLTDAGWIAVLNIRDKEIKLSTWSDGGMSKIEMTEQEYNSFLEGTQKEPMNLTSADKEAIKGYLDFLNWLDRLKKSTRGVGNLRRFYFVCFDCGNTDPKNLVCKGCVRYKIAQAKRENFHKRGNNAYNANLEAQEETDYDLTYLGVKSSLNLPWKCKKCDKEYHRSVVRRCFFDSQNCYYCLRKEWSDEYWKNHLLKDIRPDLWGLILDKKYFTKESTYSQRTVRYVCPNCKRVAITRINNMVKKKNINCKRCQKDKNLFDWRGGREKYNPASKDV